MYEVAWKETRTWVNLLSTIGYIYTQQHEYIYKEKIIFRWTKLFPSQRPVQGVASCNIQVMALLLRSDTLSGTGQRVLVGVGQHGEKTGGVLWIKKQKVEGNREFFESARVFPDSHLIGGKLHHTCAHQWMLCCHISCVSPFGKTHFIMCFSADFCNFSS